MDVRRRARRRARRRSGATVAAAAILVLIAVTAAPAKPSDVVARSVDRALCPFPLEVTVRGAERPAEAHGLTLIGPGTVTLRNRDTGRSSTLTAEGTYSVDQGSGSIAFRGHRLWLSLDGNVPFLSTDGTGTLKAPLFALTGGAAHATVVDPCALVGPAAPPARPASGPAPWRLPSHPLTRFARAGLIPVRGALVRHDHVHLDVLVEGRKVAVPAGVGMAEPVDTGPCPPGPPFGDCATGHIFTAKVAVVPVHTHSTSGLIHIESDRPGTFTLGQFFDAWGVRFDSSCVGGYCTGNGKRLQAFVNGKPVPGDPRSIVLGYRQEIAVVYGTARQLRAVPSSYTGGWPGHGCGGTSEPSCLPKLS